MKYGRTISASSVPKPSQVKHEYWLYAERKKGDYPETRRKSGKWLIFAPISQIDEVWMKIKLATEDGRLGDLAKVANAKPNPIATNSGVKVICVYPYAWTDEADVKRVRQELRVLGITSKITYKTDEDTSAGKYSSQSDKRISKYYE